MDKREFTVIENELITQKPVREKIAQTNPIAKKFHQFHNENIGKFKVKDIFKP